MCFYIRPQGKFTARLMQKSHPRLIVEGPYEGKSVKLQNYDTILLVAGGSGVSVTISYLKSFLFLAENESVKENPGVGVGVGKKIRFLWAARQEALVREIVARELAAVADATGVEIEIDIFVTSAEAQVWGQLDEKVLERAAHKEVENGSGSGSDNETEPRSQSIKYHYGQRPNLEQVVGEVIEEGARTAVVVCGPPEMADEGRRVVHGAVGRGASVEFLDVGFAW